MKIDLANSKISLFELAEAEPAVATAMIYQLLKHIGGSYCFKEEHMNKFNDENIENCVKLTLQDLNSKECIAEINDENVQCMPIMGKEQDR